MMTSWLPLLLCELHASIYKTCSLWGNGYLILDSSSGKLGRRWKLLVGLELPPLQLLRLCLGFPWHSQWPQWNPGMCFIMEQYLALVLGWSWGLVRLCVNAEPSPSPSWALIEILSPHVRMCIMQLLAGTFDFFCTCVSMWVMGAELWIQQGVMAQPSFFHCVGLDSITASWHWKVFIHTTTYSEGCG